MNGNSALRCSLFLGLGLALSSGAQARTWTVEKDGSGDFTIVQEALDAAATGDTIRIGAGRFEDFSYSGTSELVTIGRVRVPDLVIIGVSPEETILGPETRIPDTHDAEYNILRLEPATGAEIRNLSLVNSRVALNNSGRLTLDGVRVAGHWAGIFDGSSDPLVVRNSHFEECTNYGILTGPTTAPVTVEDCTFFNAEGAVFFNTVESGVVRRCTFSADRFQLTMVMVSQGTYAVIEDCRFLASPEYFGVWVSSASADLNNNWYGIGNTNLGVVDGSFVQGSGNVFQGGVVSTIRLEGYNSGLSISGNDIYSPGMPAVLLRGYMTSPTKPLDLIGNWWGTTEAGSIQAEFVFEISDPDLVDLQWQPFLTEPVPVEAASIGGLKARFRSP